MSSFYTIKKDQSHVYNKDGKRLFITRLVAKPLAVSQIKTDEKDGYKSLQVVIGSKSKVNKPIAGHLKKLNVKPLFIREIKTEGLEKNIGEEVKITDIFAIGDKISVKSKAKGRGFAGAVKRHGFAGGPKTHGQTDRQRSVGSIGQGTSPGRVHKGKKMPGRMGGKNVTLKGRQIVNIDEANQEIWITGSVPGSRGILVEIQKLTDGKFIGLIETEKPETKLKEDTKVETVKADDQKENK